MELRFPGTYERAKPIFDRARRTFFPAIAVTSVVKDGTACHLTLSTRNGPDLTLRVTFPAPSSVRLQRGFGPLGDHLSEMLVGPPPTLPVSVIETETEVRIDAGGPTLVVERAPWRVTFGEFRTEPKDTNLVEWLAEPGGWALEDGRTVSYETFSLRPGEELFGLGERFLGPSLRGRRLAHWIDEPFGSNTSDRLHKSVPFFHSSRGYGVFVHHGEEAAFDFGSVSASSASVLVEAPELDLFVFLGTPKEVLAGYTAVTGRPFVPPEWSFGIWMSRCMYRSRAEVVEVVERSAELGIPVVVVSIDPMWLVGRSGGNYDTCDFVYDEDAFGPLPELVAWLNERGVHLCLWVNPLVMEGTDAFLDERLCGSGRGRDPVMPGRAFVDFTGAGATWWAEEMRRLMDMGVEAFKLDYGETLPVDTVMADGRTGAQVHNLYPLLFSKVARDAGVPISFTRAATAGSQRYPLHWSGDSQGSWAGMAGALRGGLSLAWSGFAHWTTDIGGFFARDLTRVSEPQRGMGQPELELYLRWMQMAMLSSHTRFHGIGPREPWVFGDEAVEMAVRFGALRERLRPYLLSCSDEAAATGCPVLRPLGLEFPDDRGSLSVETSYLLGPGLLVCPVLEPGGRVEVYVPPGRWTDHFTGAVFEGPRWLPPEVVPIERLPLLVREGHSPFGS